MESTSLYLRTIILLCFNNVRNILKLILISLDYFIYKFTI